MASAQAETETAQLLSQVPPKIAEGMAAFRRELPELLQRHEGKWAAYHGDERLGIARTQTELAGRCLAAGLKRSQFIICSIEPPSSDVIEEVETSYQIT